MKNYQIAIVVCFVMLLAACGNPYKYFGRDYPDTINPQLYFRSADVPKAYEEMGKLEVEMPESKRLEKVQQKVIDISAKHGADAIIIENFNMTTGGFTTVSSGGSKRTKKGGSVGGGAKSTKVKKNVLVKATLVKYKENLNPQKEPDPESTPDSDN